MALAASWIDVSLVYEKSSGLFCDFLIRGDCGSL